MLAFVDDALAASPVQASKRAGSIREKGRALVGDTGGRGNVAAKHCVALVDYWDSVSDLANRQEHRAAREGDALVAEDGRRLIFHTVVVMFEIDRFLISVSR